MPLSDPSGAPYPVVIAAGLRLLLVLRTVVLVGAFALVALLTLLLIVVPRAVGAVPLTVRTGSMRPTLPVGSVVIVRPVDVDDLRVGDIITFQPNSGDPILVTHRIVGIRIGSDETTFRTRGDANGAIDPAPVRDVQIRGRVWYHVPVAGRFTGRLDGTERGLAVRIFAFALLGWGAWLITGSLRDRVVARRAERP